MNFTTEQAQAVYTHDSNLIVVAGAGSGKTRVLVERYLALLERNPSWKLNSLVAITFTQKAAQEMRDRVRRSLQERVESAEDSERWSDLLSQMDSARIDTIHALCGNILRANAAEAGIDPRFDIIEPVDADSLLQDVINRVLSQLTQSEQPDPIAKLFAHYDAAKVRSVLSAFVSVALPGVPSDPQVLFNEWVAQWQHNAAQVLSQQIQNTVLMEALRWAQANHPFPKDDKLAAMWDEAYIGIQKLANYQSGVNIDDLVDTLRKFNDHKRITQTGSKKQWGELELGEAREHLTYVKAWAQGVADHIGEPPNEIDEAAAEFVPLWVQLIKRVQKGYAALKAADDLMDFNDLEDHTAHLLKNHPHVARRYLGAEFKHVLVDEFQDTNGAQWAIIQALTVPDAPIDQTARLFVVGDPKQSIYGFRGADVSVFNRVKESFRQSSLAAQVTLARSFRTHKPLIDCFNHIFGRLLTPDAASPVYDYEVAYDTMQAHREEPPCDTPPLEIMLIDSHDRDQNGTYFLNEKDRRVKLSAEELRQWEAYEIAAHIRRVVEDEKRPVYDKEAQITRPIRYSDITLLFQSTSNITLYEEGLRRAGINYVTVTGRGYYSRQEVWDLLALLECLYNPYDDLSVATVLRSPLFNLSDEALFALRIRRDENGKPYHLWDELYKAAHDGHPYVPEDERQRVAFAYRVLYDLHTLAGRVTISELLREALAKTGYLATLTGLPDGARRRANVEKLLKKAVESGRVTLSAFTQYLSDLSAREIRESEAETEATDAVTLMTVHASKGLEFPMVILPDASWAINRGSTSTLLIDPAYGVACAVYDDDEEKRIPFLYQLMSNIDKMKTETERKRLFYVAATRAQDYLLVSGQIQLKDDVWTSKGWLEWLLACLSLQKQVGIVQYDDFAVHIHHPIRNVKAIEPGRAQTEQTSLWDNEIVKTGKRFSGGTYFPPLAAAVRIEPQRYARNLTATQIGDLGGADYHPMYSERFRRSILQDAPARVQAVTMAKTGVPARIMGEIVHEALRWWRFPDKDNDMQAELTSYAWKHGIVQPEEVDYAVRTSENWLKEMRHSKLYRDMESARRVYRELPFVYETDRRVIHGVIDVLFQRPDSTWVIVDYKSSFVAGYMERPDDAGERQNRHILAKHAERYHLQVGVYAAAVEQYLASVGEPIDRNTLGIFIHYLRYGQTISVKTEQWTSALSQLESQIGKLIESLDES